MVAGVGYTRPLAKNTIHNHVKAVNNLFARIGKPFSLAEFTQENLETAITSYKITPQECHFSSRNHLYHGYVSMLKHLILKGLRGRIELTEVRYLAPCRKSEIKRTVSTFASVEAMLELNERWQVGRTRYEKDRLALIIRFGIFVALRATECLEIECSKIDLKNRTIRILGKGEKYQSVFIPDKVFSFLEKFMKKWVEPEQAKLFDGWTYNGLRIAFKRLSLKAGLNLTFHGLRHTFGTENARNGQRLELVSRAMRHADTMITQRTYYHLTEDDRVNEMRKWM